MVVYNSANSAITSKFEDVWFANSGSSHHMASDQEWFRYIETRDYTTHPIRHIDYVPFGKEGEKTCIKNVLHVPQ